MKGKITITQAGKDRVHTYSSPDDGWSVNSHIIELQEQLLVIDAQYTLTYAGEVVSYAKELRKPVTRLYITHYHPDHLLGAAAFSSPIYALAEVKARIEKVGDRVAREEHEKMGDVIPGHSPKPSELVVPGIEVIDGVQIDFIHLKHAETEDALMVGLPDHGILITQDMVYHKIHVFLGELAFDSWTNDIRHYQQQTEYTHILPGHGAPGGPELFTDILKYLATAKEAYSDCADAEDFNTRIKAAFPDYGGEVLLFHQQRFMFPKKNQKNEHTN